MFKNGKYISDEDYAIQQERKAKDRKNYRQWAHDEMGLYLNNDQAMYNRMHRIVSNPCYSVQYKGRLLKEVYGEYHNGSVRVGNYANFQLIARELWAEYVAGEYKRFDTQDEYHQYYRTFRNSRCLIGPRSGDKYNVTN